LVELDQNNLLIRTAKDVARLMSFSQITCLILVYKDDRKQTL